MPRAVEVDKRIATGGRTGPEVAPLHVPVLGKVDQVTVDGVKMTRTTYVDPSSQRDAPSFFSLIQEPGTQSPRVSRLHGQEGHFVVHRGGTEVHSLVTGAPGVQITAERKIDRVYVEHEDAVVTVAEVDEGVATNGGTLRLRQRDGYIVVQNGSSTARKGHVVVEGAGYG